MTRHLTRRRFLAGLGAGIALPALQACLPQFERRPRGTTPPSRLVVAQGADPAGLHPLLETGLVEASAYGNIYDPLVTHAPDGRLVPGLAESWERRDDRSWAFRLRRGVTFHDGEPFDAASVRFTIEQLLDPSTSSPIRAQLDAIDHVETPDARTAVIVTKRPFAPLLAELTQLMMLPPAYTDRVGFGALAERPNGTGPYRLVERVRDERIALEAHDGHWRGSPTVRTVELCPTPETATRMAVVRSGQADLAVNIPSDQVPILEREGLAVVGQPGVQALYIRLHARKPPLDDLRVRRAIAHAVDVDQIIASLYGGHARRISGPYPPEVFGYDDAAPLPAYDPELARALLRQAGVAAGTEIVFEAPRGRYPKDDQVALAVAAFLERVGLHVQLRALEWGAYLKKVQAGDGEHLFLLAGTNRTFDPHFTITRLYGNGSAFGRHYYGNATIDSWAAEAATELAAEHRAALYGSILATLRADVPALWLAQLDDLFALRPGVAWQPRADSLLWLRDAVPAPAPSERA
jgi:peptide/nickel transport system substrate-binding protein